MKKNRVGEKNKNFQSLDIEIVEYNSSVDMTIRFSDGVLRSGVAYKEFKNGSVKNLMHGDVLGIGYLGVGKYTARVNGKMSKCYMTWFNMLNRCYCLENNRGASYHGKITVCKEWHNFQVFAEWFHKNFDEAYMGNWHLDKDLLNNNSNQYSPDTCCFVPNEINTLFKKNNQSTYDLPKGVHPKDGKYQSSISKYNTQYYLGFFNTVEEAHDVYVKAKEGYLLELSEKWRGILPDKVCDNMKNFDLDRL